MSFLSRSYERHFNERPYLNHTCYLFITKTTRERTRQQSTFNTLCRGYLTPKEVRDKDAVNATLLVCEAAAWYAQQGMTLLDAIEALYKEFGYYRNALCSFAFEGESGMHTMQELMKKLRANAPEDIAGYKVESVVDYDTDGTGLPRADVLEYRLVNGAKLMVRPSGTEPKIKVYLSAVANSEEAADAINTALAKAAADMMKA